MKKYHYFINRRKLCVKTVCGIFTAAAYGRVVELIVEEHVLGVLAAVEYSTEGTLSEQQHQQ